MPKIIELEGVGPVEVPDDATDQDISELGDQLLQQKQRLITPREQLLPQAVSTTAGGPRTALPSLGESLAGLSFDVQGTFENEPLPLPEPSKEFIERNPTVGSFLQRSSRIAGSLATPSSIAALPLFAIPYVGPGLALGLGAKGLAAALGEISTGRAENVGGGLAEGVIPTLMLGGGMKRARRPIEEATPQGRAKWALIDELAKEPNFGRTADPAVQRQLGTTLNPNALADPEIHGLLAQILQERIPGQNLQVPGRKRSLDVLSRMVQPREPLIEPAVGEQPTRTAERPGGGPAQYGKLSYGAEAPTLLRNVPQPERTLTEQERLMSQSFVPAEGTTALEAQKGPNATRVRSDKGPVREEGLPVEGGEEARGQDLQREQTGKERPGASGKEGALSGETTKAVQPSGAEGVGKEQPKVPGITIPEPGKTGQESGAFSLPGPELIRTLSGFKKGATVAGQQLFNRVRNLVHPDEMRAYEKAGLRTFLARPRSPDDVAKWMEEHGPRVETKVITESTNRPEEGSRASRAQELQGSILRFRHELETAGFNPARDDAKDLVGKPELQEKMRQLMEAQEKLNEIDFAEELEPSALDPHQFRQVASKDAPQKMVVVRVPRKEIPENAPGEEQTFTGKEEPLHTGSHLGSEDVNVLGWTRGHDDVVGGKQATVLDEVQSDWAQGRRRAAEARKRGDVTAAERLEKQYPEHPLLGESQRLTLKAQIEQSLKEGKQAIVVPDAPTAMMNEGHDAMAMGPSREVLMEMPDGSRMLYTGIPAVEEGLRRGGKILTDTGITPAKIEQEGGMRQNYDPNFRILDKKGNPLAPESFPDAESAHAFAKNRTAGLGLKEGSYEISRGLLHDVMEELTGVKGEPVDLGPHQNAYVKTEDQLLAEAGNEFGEVSHPIPKAGLPRDNLIFRNPDGTLKTTATGLLYDLSKVKQRTEPFKLFGSDKMSEAKVGGIKIPEPGTKGGEAGAFVLPPILQKIVEKLTPEKGKPLTDAEVEYGTKGPVIMFRSAATEEKIATSPQGIGRIPGLGQIFDPRATAKDPVMRAILTGQSMMFKAKQISTLFLEATKVLPRAFMEDNTGKATLANGTKLPTSDVIRREIANPGSQPLTADQRQFVMMWRVLRKGLVDYARSEGVRKVIDDQGTVVNLSKYSFPTSSYYDYETGRILREPDAFVRVSKFMEAIYSAVAAQRLANHPALQGRPASSGPATLAEGGSFVPWARGRIFPKEIADEINRYYGAQPHSFARQLTSANDFLKSVKYTMDVSAPFNQGLLMMTRFPIRWTHATLRSYIALADTKQLSRYLQPRMEDAQEFVTHGGSLGSLQDFLIGAQKGALASRIPGVKQLVYPFIRRSAESMNTFLSIAKLEMFRALKQSTEVKDLPKLVESIENLSLSGRMEAIGLTPARSLAERIFFNAPSYLRAAANITASILQPGLQGNLVRHALATFAGSLSLLMLALYKKAEMSDEEIKERFDTGSSKFLRYPVQLKNGDVLEEGPGNVVIQIARLMGNTIDVASGKKPSGSGIQNNPLLRWLSYRVSPLGQLAAEIYTGKDYLWRDISAKEAVARQMLPISLEQFWGREKPETKAVMAGTSFLGLSSYPENYSAARNRLQGEKAKELFGKDYEKLLPRERAKVTDAIKPSMDVKREETGPPSLEFIEKMDKIRQEKLTQGLDAGQQDFLKKHNLKLPSYRLQSTIRGTEVFFTKKEEELYEGFLVQEYRKAVERLQANPDFDSISQKSREVRFERVTSRAREVAKRRLQAEIRAVH